MNAFEFFMQYAAEFEKTYLDDNWERLRPFFAEDASYEIKGDCSPCLLTGVDAILQGTKKSVNGLDRRFEQREIIPGSDMRSDEETMSISWKAKYTSEGFEPLFLIGFTELVCRGGKILSLSDDLTGTQPNLDAWFAAGGFDLDVSYV